MAIDTKALLAEVQENARRLRGCALHRFAAVDRKLGQKFECLECGGTIDGVRLLFYIDGYKAAGGDPNDIWTGWTG
jgi:hypothetical protein